MTRMDAWVARGAASLMLIAGIAALATGAIPSCSETERPQIARAQRVTSNNQLIGGPSARGEIGDYLLENDHVRFIIQDLNYNRGSGLFGGSLIDADLVRLGSESDLLAGNGRDSFGEMFPAFFLEVVDPDEIEIINDGTDGEAAIIEVRGRGGEFVTMLRLFNQVMVNSYDAQRNLSRILGNEPPRLDQEPQVEFSARYILEPDARHLRVISSLRNISDKELQFPNRSIINLLSSALGIDLGSFTVPTGQVLGFGKLNSPFLPGIGYNLQFGLQDAYADGVALPALPGHRTPVVATSSNDGVSYGFAIESGPRDGMTAEEVAAAEHFVYAKDQELNAEGEPYYGGTATPEDLLFLFYASGFGGVFTHQLPSTLEAGESFEAVSYLFVGDGDVSSIWDEVYRVRGAQTSEVTGRLIDGNTGQPAGARETLLIYAAREDTQDPEQQCSVEGTGRDRKEPYILSQVFSQRGGAFRLELPAGTYCYRTRSMGRIVSPFVRFEVDGRTPKLLEPVLNPRGRIDATVVGESGDPIPARITVVGVHEYVEGADSPRDFLFELDTGEPWRVTDMVPDTAGDPQTRRYIEQVMYTGADGRAVVPVRPNRVDAEAEAERTYKVYFSRGPEYDVDVKTVQIRPGETLRVAGELRRTVDTPGYLCGDFHLHARGSIDSGLDYNSRVRSLAGEGLEVAVASDHNFISDYTPYIIANGLQPWMKSVIGLELTTFEAGHFNAFPLEYDVESANRGSFQWQGQPPGLLFEELRQRGTLAPGDTIVQVNHPRDAILGYFEQHNVDALNSDVELPFEADDATLIDAAIAPNGDAFYTQDERGDYDTTFSWNFDAIEVFSGKRSELLRHFRADKDTLRPVYIEHFAIEELDEQQLDPEECADARQKLETECGDPQADGCPEAQATADTCTVAETEAEARADEYLSMLGEGKVIVCDDGDVSFAGHLDDWYNMLNNPRPYGIKEYEEQAIADPERVELYRQTYKRYTATGNSDSHSAEFDDPGYPRNYFWTGHDDPQQLTDQQLSDALQNHRNIVTNGPFITLELDGSPVGSKIEAEGGITATIQASVPNWIRVDRWRIVGNGEVVAAGDIELEEGATTWSTDVELDVPRDTWFVLEVEGDQSMFPVLSPNEIPPFDLESAIGGLAEPFGFGFGPEGLSPELTFQVTPFAFTNPIWVVADGDGVFDPPGTPLAKCQGPLLDPNAAGPSAILDPSRTRKLGGKRLDAMEMPFKVGHEKPVTSRLKGEVRDVRIIFEAWGHSH